MVWCCIILLSSAISSLRRESVSVMSRFFRVSSCVVAWLRLGLGL